MSLFTALLGGPSLPFPVGAKLVTLGDSIFWRGSQFTVSGLRLSHDMRSEAQWANAMLGYPVKHEIWQDGTNFKGANQGVNGDEPSDMYARLPALLDAMDLLGGNWIIVVAGGTNGATSVTAATHINYLGLIIAAIRARGSRYKIILGKVRPRVIVADPANGYTATDVRWQRMYDINAWTDTQYVPGIVELWDNFNPTRNLSAPTQLGEAISWMLEDDVHNLPPGAFANAVTLMTPLSRCVQPGSWIDWTATNYMTNPTETGTAGLKTGVPLPTGTFPNNKTVGLSSGSLATLVGSRDGSGYQTNTFGSGAGTASVNNFRYAHTPTTALSAMLARPAGTWFQYFADVDAQLWEGHASFSAELVDSDGSANYLGLYPNNSTMAGGGIEQDFSGIIGTTPIMRAGRTQFRARISNGVYVGNHPRKGTAISGTGYIKPKREGIFEVPSPELEFPF